MSEINYLVAGLIVIASLVFVIWLVRRNLQDKKSYEHDVIDSELKPEEDNDHDEIR
ncbi:hypothetical protein [Mucilaginibacter glaciei]|uniref:Uncharacterized protein n=1 Tax=Mucilaginibacter glaciei TaxID=2772109 RepID=A0A926S2P5_9SPHI|nr:hypothetical protein [Mucilaginibacter glaciei]MBD1395350.1 hypothetical protein [Mucilaginibacter glaciei]